MKTFKLHLIRHGITQGNLDGLYIGSQTDLPLCEQGKAHLRNLKQQFVYPQPDLVFTSPLARATQSASILFDDTCKQVMIEQLTEANFGVFEGKKMSELVNDPNFARWMDPAAGYTPPGAEPTAEFHKRCAHTLKKLFEFMIKSNITEAACVTHGGVIMSMLTQGAVPQRRPEDWMADAGCGYTLQTDAAMWMRDAPAEAVEIVPAGYLDGQQ